MFFLQDFECGQTPATRPTHTIGYITRSTVFLFTHGHNFNV